MNCFEEDQIFLYLTKHGLSKEQKLQVEKHLSECKICAKKKLELEQEIKTSALESEKECELVRNNLIGYISGEIKAVPGVDIEEHLNECETCKFLYNSNKKRFTRQEIEALEIPVPDHLLPNILNAVTDEIAAERQRESLRLKSSAIKIKNELKQFVECIKISLQQLEPAPGFLRKVAFNAKKISHSGGDLVLDIGEKNVGVTIFSLQDLELAEQRSDTGGKVVFKDFEKAEYKIFIEGFDIREIRYVKQ